MSSWEKLLARILTLSNDLRYEELKRVLEEYGYTVKQPKSGGSHFTFRKPGCMPITIPKHEPIKKVYVEMVKEVVESERDRNEED
ncbi:MAG: type II toxin-antitoxin system HicA family toxin [Clostridia bacterium]|nr:type II toxin-antitoxin system HicA family toxin [Clostridia bacterium]